MAVHHPIEELIPLCIRQDRRAQQQLYDRFKALLFAVCRRYIPDEATAEDVFIQGFYRIYAHLQDYRGEGSFEGWIRRIMVNECLMYLRKEHNLHLTVALTEHEIADAADDEAEYPYSYQELMIVIDALPTGYRTVFNLYVLEDFKHREIAEILGISINTSKSQLILARKKILELMQAKKKNNSKIQT
ncbi:MAG: sigma-70 family RNA polymerase sigma factor [Saprospiraceae bacterium]|nr:sigma-70 family RNA polymerase sigma factor [Saprospiraceae bacterium]